MRSSQPLKVLIVEDNLILSLLQEKIVTQCGYEVIGKVTTGEEADLICRENSPDLILMDIFLKGELNGLQAARRIWRYSTMPIIFISGNFDLYQKKRDSLTGVHDFITKPFTKNQLLTSIDHLLSRQGSQHTA